MSDKNNEKSKSKNTHINEATPKKKDNATSQNIEINPLSPSEVLSEAEAEAQENETRTQNSSSEHAGFSLEVLGENVGEAMGQLREGVTYWLERGRFNKVRIKRNGKAVLPDLPVGVLVALEAATFFWAGLLRAAVVNVAGRAFFDVELINEAEEHYRAGLEHYLAGELDAARTNLKKALQVDSRYAKAHLQLGILQKVQGKTREAKYSLEQALKYDEGELKIEINAHLKRIQKAHDLT